jgi:hypothetical protein
MNHYLVTVFPGLWTNHGRYGSYGLSEKRYTSSSNELTLNYSKPVSGIT